MTAKAHVLLIEDDEIVRHIIGHTLADQDVQLTCKNDGASAWEALNSDIAFDAVLLDRGLPDTDGMALLQRIKALPQFQTLPVIMHTCLGDVDSIKNGLAAGAYYYLIKPVQPNVLIAVVDAAIGQTREMKAIQSTVREIDQTLCFLESGVFRYRTLAQAQDLANSLARTCPDPSSALFGLQELLVNAVEHGNLSISYAEKTALLLDNNWLQEVHKRLADPVYSARTVTVELKRSMNKISFTIVDEGEGFNWRPYLDFNAERAFDPHGRGIALAAKTSFDTLQFHGVGNCVEACINLSPDS